MTTIYFPFTAIAPDTASALSACFSKTLVYGVSAPHSESSRAALTDNRAIEFRVPITGNEDQLTALLKEYQNWADIHQGKTADDLKSQAGRIPFYSDASVARIRADLKKRVAGHRTKADRDLREETLAARLFLALAQIHDAHTAGMIKDLILVEQVEQDLFDRLKGEPSEDRKRLGLPAAAAADRDVGAHMAVERIRSWSLLFLRDATECTAFATDSPGVLEHLSVGDAQRNLEPVFDLSQIPVRAEGRQDMTSFRASLFALLEELGANHWADLPTVPRPPKPSGGDKTVSLSVYQVRGVGPRAFFSQFASAFGMPPDVGPVPDSMKNTTFCLVQTVP